MAQRKGFAVNLLLFLATVTVCVLLAEAGLRIFMRHPLRLRKDERNLAYRYDSLLGWFPREKSRITFTGSRSIIVEHNSRGFRDDEPVVAAPQRIVFLGDSFVWGYDAEKPERFTEKLRTALPRVALYNLGVSGYGTDQEYLLLRQQFDFYRPAVVFLLYCADNDEADNSSNTSYGYFKPYFQDHGNDLQLEGTPVPKSDRHFLAGHDYAAQSYVVRLMAKAYYRLVAPPVVQFKSPTFAIIAALQTFVEAKGAALIVGLQSSNPELEKFLTQNRIPYVDVGNSYRYPNKGRHWTPEGHSYVSRKILEFLTENRYVTVDAAPGATQESGRQ